MAFKGPFRPEVFFGSGFWYSPVDQYQQNKALPYPFYSPKWSAQLKCRHSWGPWNALSRVPPNDGTAVKTLVLTRGLRLFCSKGTCDTVVCSHFYFDGDLSSLFYIYILWFLLYMLPVVQQAFSLFLSSDSLRRQLLFNHCQRQLWFLEGLIRVQGIQRRETEKVILSSNKRLEES